MVRHAAGQHPGEDHRVQRVEQAEGGPMTASGAEDHGGGRAVIAYLAAWQARAWPTSLQVAMAWSRTS